MPGDVRRVTVHGGGHRVDLSVPAGVPIVELIPAVAGLCHTGPDAAETTPPAWGLARIGGPPLSLSASLDQVEVVDGEVLCLVDTAVWRAPVVRPAGEAVADTMRTSPRWDAAARAVVLAGLAGAQLALAAVIGVGAATGLPGAAAAVGVAVALLILASIRWRGRVGESWAASRPALIVAAVAFAGVGGWALAGGSQAAPRLAAGAAGATLGALAAYPMARSLAPGAAVALGSLAAGAAAVALHAGPAQAASVLAVVAVAVLRVLPPLLNRLLAGAPDEAGPEALARAARRARRLLASLSAGLALTAAGAVAVLVAFGDLVAGALAAAAVLALLLQVPTYRFLQEALPLALAAGASLLAVEIAVAVRVLFPAGLAAAGVALLAAAGAAIVVGSVVRRPPVAAARWAELAWPVVDAAMVPLALAELGAFAALGRLVRTVAG
jgi:type VII secretion integral membrane protein EccD